MPVCVHVGSGRPAAAAERFDNPYFVHATTHAFEQMIGVMCIVGGGILERYPKLKVAFLEAGAGWVPYWMERLDEHYEYMSPAVPLMKKAKRIHEERAVYYSFEPDEQTLKFRHGTTSATTAWYSRRIQSRRQQVSTHSGIRDERKNLTESNCANDVRHNAARLCIHLRNLRGKG